MKITNPENLTAKGIKNIIFDWGGVITNLNFDNLKKSFSALGLEYIEGYFSNSNDKFLIDFEVAKISPTEFREKVKSLTKQEISDAEIDNAWNSLLGDTPVERIEVIKQLGKNYRTFLLSNTNIIHAEFYNNKLRKDYDTDHEGLFEKVYYSHDLRQRKPNTDIFESALKDAQLRPEETLFIDDLEKNIDTAASLGIQSFHLKSNYDIAQVFKDW